VKYLVTEYIVPEEVEPAVAVKVVLFPAQIEVLVAVMLGAGRTFTVYVLVVEALFAVTVQE
jgi:hypothetical protein